MKKIDKNYNNTKWDKELRKNVCEEGEKKQEKPTEITLCSLENITGIKIKHSTKLQPMQTLPSKCTTHNERRKRYDVK